MRGGYYMIDFCPYCGKEHDVKLVEVISNSLHSIFNKIGLTPKYFQKKN